MDKKIRVFLCKPGLDGHDRGVLIVGQALRDAGMEVIYSGLKQTAENVVEAAIQEDVDVVGISLLSGAHMALVPRITGLLRENGADDMLVLAGGVIPHDDAEVLEREHGVARVFGPGSDTREIVKFIQEWRERR
jgi:methylmalonyl-CoA mutase C-terminal domain/subunit